MRRAIVTTIVLAGLMTWAGESVVPVVSASSAGLPAVPDRGADQVTDVTRAAAPPFHPASVLDGRRRPQPQPLPVVAVPFVCAVHLAEAADAAAGTD